MAELAFWDDLETFENGITPSSADSLFDPDLFASEVLAPTVPSTSPAHPATFSSPSHPSAFPSPTHPSVFPSPSHATAFPSTSQAPTFPSPSGDVVVPVPVPPPSAAGATSAAAAKAGRSSFLDDPANCPLRRRVKITITGGKRCAAAAMAGGGNGMPPKRARAGMLRFAGAGEAIQPRFSFDIRRKANPPGSGGIVGKIGGTSGLGVTAKVGKRRVGKDAASVGARGGKAGAGASKMMVRVPPAPRAKTLTGVAAVSAASAVAGNRDARASRVGVGGNQGSPLDGAWGAASGAANVSSVSRGKSVGRPRGRGGRRGTGIQVAPASASVDPLPAPAVSEDVKQRLAALPVGGASLSSNLSPLPSVLPALEAVGSAAIAYRTSFEDEDPCPVEDVDFISRLLLG